MSEDAPVMDIDAALCGWLEDRLAIPVVTSTPEDLTGRLPLMRWHNLSGPDDGFRLAQSDMDLHTFAATRVDASHWAEMACTLLTRRLPATGVDTISENSGIVVTKVECPFRPRWLDYDNPDVQRFQATYRIWWHVVTELDLLP